MATDPSRRTVLRSLSLSALPVVVAGCNTGGDSTQSSGDRSTTQSARTESPNTAPSAAPSPTKSPPPTTSEQPIDTPTASPIDDNGLSPTGTPLTDLLPTTPEGWTRVETHRSRFFGAGGYLGIKRIYESPETVEYHVVIVLYPDEPSIEDARRHACEVGWQVVVPHGRHVYMASTGTVKQTYTPETPAVDRDYTPVPDTREEARQLLSRSPALTSEIIDRNEIDCGTATPSPTTE